MKKILLTALGVLLTIGGLAALGFAAAAFLRALPEGVPISPYEIGQYLPRYAAPEILAAALGIILLTFRRHY